MSSQFVNFNVSGTRFTTFKDTVLREPASRLALLVREVLPAQKDEQGAIFIDRDAKYFQLVLNFLRDGWCSLPSNAEERKELAQEARFYQLMGLEAWVQNQETLLSSPLKPRSESPMRPQQQPQQQQQQQQYAPGTPGSSPPLRGPSISGAQLHTGMEYAPSSSPSPWSSPTRVDLGPAAYAAGAAGGGAGNAGQEFRPSSAGAYAGTVSGSPAFQRATQALAAAQAALAAGPGLGSRPGTARPLAFMASIAAEAAASSGDAGHLVPAPVASSPSDHMGRQMWLPSAAVDEYRWTTKYLRSNQRLQEVVNTLLELAHVPPHRSWHAGRVTIRFAAECCHDGVTSTLYARPLTAAQPQTYQVVQVTGSSGWSFECSLRPGSDQALLDKYCIVDCIQDNWFVLTAVLKDQYGITLEEDPGTTAPRCAGCRRTNMTLIMQKQY